MKRALRIYPITVENAEWDMALKMNGRPDVKFILDGVDIDVTTLTQPTQFTEMRITESSIGYVWETFTHYRIEKK